jgi:hypothetical protein
MDCDASPVSYHRKGLQITKGDRLGKQPKFYFLISEISDFRGNTGMS